MTNIVNKLKERFEKFVKYVDDRLNKITVVITGMDKDNQKKMKKLEDRITSLEKDIQKLQRNAVIESRKQRQGRHDFVELRSKVQQGIRKE